MRAGRQTPSFRSQLVYAIIRELLEELGAKPRSHGPAPMLGVPDEDAGAFDWEETRKRAGEVWGPSPRQMPAAVPRATEAESRAAIALFDVWAGDAEKLYDARRPRRAGRPRWRRRRRATDAIAAEFQIVYSSLQHDHIHLIVEAASVEALSAGLRRFVIRLAKRINFVVRGTRSGKIWGDRYHRRDLLSPSAVRTALIYVLQNGRKHGVCRAWSLDPLSSALRFDGWADMPAFFRPRDPLAPRTWLLDVGWRQYGGRIRIAESPRSKR